MTTPTKLIKIPNDTDIKLTCAECAMPSTDAPLLDFFDDCNEIYCERCALIEFPADRFDMHRDELTETLLQNSLCPLHQIDYAICFDDNDAECAQIRRIHTSHDT